MGWDDDARAKAAAVAGGYPYFLQLYAFEAWEAAAHAGAIQRITSADAVAGEPAAERQIEAWIYGARFEGATGPSARTCSPCRISWTQKATGYVPATSLGYSIAHFLLAPPTCDADPKGSSMRPSTGCSPFPSRVSQQYIASCRSDEA